MNAKERHAAFFARVNFPKAVVRMKDGRLLCVEDVRGGNRHAHWVCRTPDRQLHRSFIAALRHLDNQRLLAEQAEAHRRQMIVERREAYEAKRRAEIEMRRTIAAFKNAGIELRGV